MVALVEDIKGMNGLDLQYLNTSKVQMTEMLRYWQAPGLPIHMCKSHMDMFLKS